MFQTLKGKISAVYIGLVFLIAAVSCVSVLNLIDLERSVNGLMTRNYQSISYAQEMLDALAQQNLAVVTFLSVDNDSGIDRFYSHGGDFFRYLNMEAHNITEKGEQSIVDRVFTSYNEFQKANTRLAEIKSGKGKAEAYRFYNAQITPKVTEIQNQIKSLIALNQTAMFNSKDRASEKARFSVYALLCLSFAAVLGGFLVSGYFINRFLLPLRQLTEGINRVRAGELDLKLNIRTNDETGRLAREFNEMTGRLSVYEQSTMGSLVSERNKSVAIVRSISDPLIVLDVNYRIMLINHACESFFTISEQEVVGKHFLEAVHRGELFDLVAESAEYPDGHTEKIIPFYGEENTYYNVVITRIFDSDQKPSGFILLMQNVTELKELEKMKTDFMATVSHELKTPLTSILMGASMLEDKNLGVLNSGQWDVVRTITEDTGRMADFVSELLEISRIESGKAIYSFKPCSLEAISESSCHRFADAAGRQGVELKNMVSDSLPLVYADFEKVTWVINNLLSNALKYTDERDSITISAERDGDFLRVAVTDTGEGIPQEYLERIFEKFVRVRERDIELRGTGIGLSVSKELITAHRGKIWAESEPGQGSTFYFTLPIYFESGGEAEEK
ncbi:MAG TPA: ATP-binding protein [Clostridia bacterium]|nr:ATP-binding protein [Clostridia bacterium]